MVEKTQVARSKRIQRRTGKTFHVATRLLPKRIRHPTYVLYGFFRIADDIVDTTEPVRSNTQRRRLSGFESAALGDRPTEQPILRAFSELRRQYDIPDREVSLFLRSMEADIDQATYDSVDALSEYLRGSAVSVAYMMLAVMEPDDFERARPHARALGEAFQLTNFLRDVREDVLDYGRVYIPGEVLSRHGLEHDDIFDLEFTESIGRAIRDELHRTENRYRTGVAGISLLPRDCQFPVLLAAVFYAEYHRLIRESGFDVVSNRPTLPKRTYLRLVIETGLRWLYTRDPEAVFYHVSPIDPEPSTAVPTIDGQSRWDELQRSMVRFGHFLTARLFPGRSD